MTEDPVWPIEQHTKAKHELLRRYLGAWYPVLVSSGYTRRVMFLDGFAGPGVYSHGEAGSPLIALQTLVGHAHFARWSATEFVFLFVEVDEERHSNLDAEIASFWSSLPKGKPLNIKVHVIKGEFQEIAREILSDLEDQKANLAPTLAFIDPFGWSGVPMSLIRDLLSFDRCEVLFSFMYDSVNRWVGDSRPGIAQHFEALFHTDDRQHTLAAELSGDDRRAFLSDLYVSQLRDVAGFRYVRKFEMLDVSRGRTAYFLVFGTRHRKGLEMMKDAMWALDPVAGARFSGFAGDQEMLFSPEPDFAPLCRAVRERFAGMEVSVEEIEAFVIDETDYKSSHYKRQVLREMEKAGELECLSDRKRAYTYPAGVRLAFVSDLDD